MHYWGDDWKYWDTLNKAIDGISDDLKTYRIGHYAKEKYGTMRLDFLHYWDGTIHGWFYPSRCCVRGVWRKFWGLDLKLSTFLRNIGIVNLVHKWQHKHHYGIIKYYCEQYPEITNELLFDCGLLDYEIKKLKGVNMRNPNRIPVMLEVLEEIWKKSPDLRLGQLMFIITDKYFKDRDTFNIEDDELLKVLFKLKEE